MEEAALCTMLVLNVGSYRKQLRFRGVPLGQTATLPMCLVTVMFVFNTPPLGCTSEVEGFGQSDFGHPWLFPTGMGVRASNG
jgi:hypothetical protein